ncbi:MAG: hypothetical protein AB7G21_08530 [Dehalococcoidia bacterium]
MTSGFRARLATIGAWLRGLPTVERMNGVTVLAGMGCLTAGAFEVHTALGLATLGVSLIAAGSDIRRR